MGFLINKKAPKLDLDQTRGLREETIISRNGRDGDRIAHRNADDNYRTEGGMTDGRMADTCRSDRSGHNHTYRTGHDHTDSYHTHTAGNGHVAPQC